MNVTRFVLMTLLEVVAELCHRRGCSDLVEKLQPCVVELKAVDEAEVKEG